MKLPKYFVLSKITVSDHSAFRLFIPEPDAFFVRKMLKFIIIFHFVSTLYYELVKERHNKRPKEVPTSFPKIKKVRAHVERWISGVEGVFQDNGGWISEDAGGFPVRKVDFRQKGVFQTRRVVFRT